MQRVLIGRMFAGCLFFVLFGFSAGYCAPEVDKPMPGPQLDSSPVLMASVTPDHEGINVDVESDVRKDPSVSVGLGVSAVPDYEGSKDYQALPLLFIRSQWQSGRYIQFLGKQLKFNAVADENWRFGPLVGYRGKRNDDVDNDKVAKMREVDASLEMGAFLGYRIHRCHIGVEGARDVADGHDGFVARLEAGYGVPFEKELKLDITVFTTYADDDYMKTYFSVDADNAARSGLAVYDADSGIKDLGVTLTIGFTPWNQWGLTGIFGYTRLVGDAKNSPIVDVEGSASQFLGGVMVTYRF